MTPHDKRISEVRALCTTLLGPRGYATTEALDAVAAALRDFPDSPALWCLRGDTIQLLDTPGDDPSLAAAEQCYIKAISLAPTDPVAHESLGCFYDAVLDDPARAEPFFRRAISCGAGPSAQAGLNQALEQLQRGSR
jgi:tetratricopeptide (TPR) repeat protein